MDYRSRRLRSGLLLGTAFVAGVVIGPASGLISRHPISMCLLCSTVSLDCANSVEKRHAITVLVRRLWLKESPQVASTIGRSAC